MPAQRYWRFNGRILALGEACTVDANGKPMEAPVTFTLGQHEEVDA